MLDRFRLYCGLSSPLGEVSDERYESFLAHHVAPKFSGFTSFNAQGYWLGAKENTRIIELLADPSKRSAIDELAAQYAETFAQDSVLVTQERIESSFIEAPSRHAQNLAAA